MNRIAMYAVAVLWTRTTGTGDAVLTNTLASLPVDTVPPHQSLMSLARERTAATWDEKKAGPMAEYTPKMLCIVAAGLEAGEELYHRDGS